MNNQWQSRQAVFDDFFDVFVLFLMEMSHSHHKQYMFAVAVSDLGWL